MIKNFEDRLNFNYILFIVKIRLIFVNNQSLLAKVNFILYNTLQEQAELFQILLHLHYIYVSVIKIMLKI